MFYWEPEGHYCHSICTAIAPFWLSTDDNTLTNQNSPSASHLIFSFTFQRVGKNSASSCGRNTARKTCYSGWRARNYTKRPTRPPWRRKPDSSMRIIYQFYHQRRYTNLLYSLWKLSEFSLCLSLRSLSAEWRQWSFLLEWISSEPDEIPLVE